MLASYHHTQSMPLYANACPHSHTMCVRLLLQSHCCTTVIISMYAHMHTSCSTHMSIALWGILQSSVSTG